MNRLWPSPVGQLRGFLGILGVFLVYYFVSNAQSLWSSPRLVEQMHGSLAQFVLPYGVALGVFQHLAARSAGLRHLFSGSDYRPVGWMMWVAIKASALAAALVALNGLAVTILNVVGGVRPQLSLLYFAYPVAFLLIGVVAGVLLGPVADLVFRPERTVTAYLLSVGIGIAVFLVVVLGGGTSTSSANSLALGAVVVEPYEQVRSSLLFSQTAFITLLAMSLALMALANQSSLERLRIAFIGVAATALVGSLVAAIAYDGDDGILAARDRAEVKCADSKVDICAWEDGARGVRLLETAVSDNSAIASLPTFPDAILQEGVPGVGTVEVANMPTDEEQADVYLAEVVVRGAGCSNAQIGESSELQNLIDSLLEQINGGPAVGAAAMSALERCA